MPYSPTKTIRDLADSGEIFNVLRVVNREQSPSWGTKQFKAALENASQILSTQYREGKLVRYGPVQPPVPGSKLDYARLGAQIAYASAEKGPSKWDTPNGTFLVLHHEGDQIKQAGRRVGTDRDDSKPWSEQQIVKSRKLIDGIEPKDSPVDTRTQQRRIEELQGQLGRANKEIERLQRSGSMDTRVSHETERAIEAIISLLVPRLRGELYEPIRDELKQDLSETVPEIVAERMLGVPE